MAEGRAALALLVLTFCQGLRANPVDTWAAQLQTAQCGDDLEITISLQDSVTFSSSYLTELNNGQLPTDCYVHWRIALEPIEGIENWGIAIGGNVALQDDSNTGTSCSSSFVRITDEDAEGDQSSVTSVECGSTEVDFVTYEDSVSIILITGSGDTSGEGFSLTVRPIYECGGMLRGEVGEQFIIATPGYPEPYRKELSCFWDLTVPEDSTVRLECQKFMILRRRKGVCWEALRISDLGVLSYYCGKELNGKKKALEWQGVRHMDFYFRSYSRAFGWPGFNCTLSIQ